MIPGEFKKDLSRAKNISFTSKYIILYKGASISIYDHDFICKVKIPKLNYVYRGYVSPDESKLLLVSSGNRFYVLSLDDFSFLSNFPLRRPYNGNLEGMACWCSSDSFLVPIQNSDTMLSKLRRFHCGSPLTFEDLIPEKFWITNITYISERNQHLLIGLDRSDHSWNLIWLDKNGIYQIYKILNFNEMIFHMDISYIQNQVILTGETKIHCCNFDGSPANAAELTPLICSGKIIFPLFFKKSKKDSNIAYFSTMDSFGVYNLNDKSLIKSYHIDYGVRDAKEVGNLLFLSTFSGIKVVSMDDIIQ